MSKCHGALSSTMLGRLAALMCWNAKKKPDMMKIWTPIMPMGARGEILFLLKSALMFSW